MTGHCQPTPQTLTGRSGSVSCGVTAPFPWILVHTRFCFFSPRVPAFPSPVEFLESNLSVPQCQIPWGFPVPLPNPQVGKSDEGPRTFITEQELLWNYYSKVCVTHLLGMGFDFNLIVPLLLSCCGFSCVLGCKVSFLGVFQCPPVNSYSILVAILVFLQKKMSACPSIPPSWAYPSPISRQLY